MRNLLFRGVCTALVTPFFKGEINYEMLEKLLTRQINAGIKCVVISGTTGEASTLSDYEKIQLIRATKAFAGDALTVIAGTGNNNTMHSVVLSKLAEANGADGILAVSPYYNKANDSGLYAHYSAIASAVQLPVILYNVPSRTMLDIPVTVYQKLSSVENIIGVKEASVSIGKIAKIRANCDDSFHIWSGNDEMAIPTISLGGKGVISVLSNVLPKTTNQMIETAMQGDFSEAVSIYRELHEFCELLFCEVNPIPVKAAMKMIGYDCGDCRLPLAAMDDSRQKAIEQSLKKLYHSGILE